MQHTYAHREEHHGLLEDDAFLLAVEKATQERSIRLLIVNGVAELEGIICG